MNVIHIMGRLGRDPEWFAFDSGDGGVASFSVATSRKWKDRDGNQKEDTQWHNVKFFGKLGEVICQYFQKGSMIQVSGELRYRKYDKDGVEMTIAEIVGSSFEFCGGSKDDSSANRTSNDRPGRNGPSGSSAIQRAREKHQARMKTNSFNDIDDDIPF